MIRKINKLLIFAAALSGAACGEQAGMPTAASRAEAIVAEIYNPSSRKVLVASHRGDWRNYPENSIPAIESVIRMGVDIMELDLKLTKDSVLVLCHDHTIDRTTSGKGRVRDITYDSIRRCKLRRAHNVVTDSLRMPTLREALELCKDRIVVNIDQGYEYYDLVLAVTEELGVTEQILIKGKRAPEIVAAKFAEHPRNMMYMPIIDILKPKGQNLFAEYREKGIVPLAYEICWVFGWGREGHETIAKIAERNLTKRAKKRIEKYLGGHSVVYYAKWMDEYRKTPEYAFTDGWHTAPVNAGLRYTDELLNPKRGNAIYGLELAVENLKDYRSLTDSAVAVNLKYVIHLVGDMHCPAHIKYTTHNMKYDVLFEDKYHKPHKFYVHSVWDNEIITTARIWSVSEWADELDRVSKAERQAIASGTPRDWLHDAAVCCEVQFEWAKPDERLGQDFLNKALPLVESQIQKAGYRLARILNDLFD